MAGIGNFVKKGHMLEEVGILEAEVDEVHNKQILKGTLSFSRQAM
ncbi:MAG: hypothetical protein Q7K98_06700 [Candidatus Omnitrophota bacterium]|nr:hypothetical protein [Candidatus Omnitrophota bacterium]